MNVFGNFCKDNKSSLKIQIKYPKQVVIREFIFLIVVENLHSRINPNVFSEKSKQQNYNPQKGLQN